jgi:hypothetical protein
VQLFVDVKDEYTEIAWISTYMQMMDLKRKCHKIFAIFVNRVAGILQQVLMMHKGKFAAGVNDTVS